MSSVSLRVVQAQFPKEAQAVIAEAVKWAVDASEVRMVVSLQESLKTALAVSSPIGKVTNHFDFIPYIKTAATVFTVSATALSSEKSAASLLIKKMSSLTLNPKLTTNQKSLLKTLFASIQTRMTTREHDLDLHLSFLEGKFKALAQSDDSCTNLLPPNTGLIPEAFQTASTLAETVLPQAFKLLAELNRQKELVTLLPFLANADISQISIEESSIKSLSDIEKDSLSVLDQTKTYLEKEIPDLIAKLKKAIEGNQDKAQLSYLKNLQKTAAHLIFITQDARAATFTSFLTNAGLGIFSRFKAELSKLSSNESFVAIKATEGEEKVDRLDLADMDLEDEEPQTASDQTEGLRSSGRVETTSHQEILKPEEKVQQDLEVVKSHIAKVAWRALYKTPDLITRFKAFAKALEVDFPDVYPKDMHYSIFNRKWTDVLDAQNKSPSALKAIQGMAAMFSDTRNEMPMVSSKS